MKKWISIFIVLFAFIFPVKVLAYENDTITLHVFHGDGCPHCADEMKFLDSIVDNYPNLKIEKYEVWYNTDNSALLQKVTDAFNIPTRGVPTNVIGETIINGYSTSIGEKIKRAIEYYQSHEYVDVLPKIIDGTYEPSPQTDAFTIQEEQSDAQLSIDVPWAGKYNLKKFSLTSAAALIGLVDGFNPCAMWILLFLISVLIGMKDKKRMWALGLTFLVTSALVYMLIMLSWISIAVKITTIIWIRNVIAIIALGGAILNLKSYFNNRNDSGCDIVDEKKRKKVFQKIRKFTSEKSFLLAIFGVMGLAISVNLVELACSAGLPLVFSELLVLNHVSNTMKFLYTLVYIFFFLIDDLIVFFVAMFTMKISGISTKYNKYSHLIGGIIMLLIGILLFFKPEWLMFQFNK